MKNSSPHRGAGRACLLLAGAAALILGSAGRAMADTSRATGQAAVLRPRRSTQSDG